MKLNASTYAARAANGIVKLEGLEVPHQDVPRAVAVRQRVELL